MRCRILTRCCSAPAPMRYGRLGCRLAGNTVGLGLGNDQGSARLMGDVASRPEAWRHGRTTISLPRDHSQRFLLSRMPILDNELLPPAELRAYAARANTASVL